MYNTRSHNALYNTRNAKHTIIDHTMDYLEAHQRQNHSVRLRDQSRDDPMWLLTMHDIAAEINAIEDDCLAFFLIDV